MTSPKITYTRTFRRLVGGTNINEQTLLATDYLNHFNEVVMLIEMIADMPECLEDAKAWAPKTYQDHFRDSNFSDRELAVQAYEHVPERYRVPFEQVVAGLNRVVATGLQKSSRPWRPRRTGASGTPSPPCRGSCRVSSTGPAPSSMATRRSWTRCASTIS